MYVAPSGRRPGRTVQTLLGHASPATTRIYVHKTAQEVADEYQDAFGTYRRPDGARDAL